LKHCHIASLVGLLLIIPLGLLAKRAAPKPVPPVVRNGVKYSAPNDNGRIGHVEASDARSGATLWDIKVFEVQIDPKLEEDVQWVFITDLKLEGNSLHVKDEKSRCYNLDLTTKTVKKEILCW
jgi:hypothetical protein